MNYVTLENVLQQLLHQPGGKFIESKQRRPGSILKSNHVILTEVITLELIFLHSVV